MGGQESGDIGPDYSDVCQPPPSDSVHGVAVVFAGPFDAEEIGVRPMRRLAEEKRPLAGTDLDVHLGVTSENIVEIKRFGQVLGLKRDIVIVFQGPFGHVKTETETIWLPGSDARRQRILHPGGTDTTWRPFCRRTDIKSSVTMFDRQDRTHCMRPAYYIQ